MIKKYFKFNEHNTNYKNEIIGGITTFITMSYIIIVNPKILEAAGMPFGAAMVATILTAFFGTLIMGIYARRPFAVASYMGENAFIAYTVVKVLGYPWQTALGAIFISGLIYSVLTISGIRSWLVNSIPEQLKIGFSAGIGLFLAFIGLNQTGIVKLGIQGAPVHVGNLSDPTILLAIFGFLLTGFLMIKKINGAMFIGIAVVSILAFLGGLISLPASLISMPPSILPTLGKLDIAGALKWDFFPIILTIFIMIFVDTMGTLIGVSYKAGLLDENGNLPEIKKPMLCDSLATMLGAVLGTTTSGPFIESAAGIEAGGKTGFASVITAFLFLTTLLFAPLLTVIPAYACGPTLIVVGMLMLSSISKIDFEDLTDAIPIFCIIALMSFTYNLGVGITAGFIVFALMKTLSGRYKEVTTGLWILVLISILFFIFYPY